VPALVAAAIASTARLTQPNTISVCGTFSINSASANVTTSPTMTGRHGTARRFSLMIKAIATVATTPSADCNDCLNVSPDSP
jgi:hypothetical protein